MIAFNSYREKSPLKNPLKKFREDVQEVEYRQDPLTGAWMRLNVDRAKRPHQACGEPAKISAKKDCMFCSKNLDSKTPKFSKRVVPEGRIESGEFVLFPNLFPFAAHHAVGVLTKRHNAALGELKPELWADAISGTIKWFKSVFNFDPRMRFASMDMNYMMPAAASVIHPHMQATVDRLPTNHMDITYRKSWDFHEKTKSNFWEEYCTSDSERKIMDAGGVSWHASFAPRAANEVTGILKGKSGFFGLSPDDIAELSKGLSKIFCALWKLGMRSANMSIIASPLDESLSHFFNMHVIIISRPDAKEIYTADRGFMEVIHREVVVSYLPEEFAKSMKKVIGNGA